MAKSRYSNTPVVDGKYFSTFLLPRRPGGIKNVDLLDGVRTVDYVYKVGDRLDHLAAKQYGEDQYWWVIALVNDINYPFASGGLIPGRLLKIPMNVRDILDKILR